MARKTNFKKTKEQSLLEEKEQDKDRKGKIMDMEHIKKVEKMIEDN